MSSDNYFDDKPHLISLAITIAVNGTALGQSELQLIRNCDYLVIGTGVAGLSSALKLAEKGQVILVSKTEAQDSNSTMAQGGIASVQTIEDNFDHHIQDTLEAGAGLCNPQIVKKVVENAPDRIRDLEKWGVQFDRSPLKSGGAVDLNREGGHSHRRILHVQDQTGRAIQDALFSRIREHPNVDLIENHIAIDLLTSNQIDPGTTEPQSCLGAYFLDRAEQKILTVFSKTTFLATGGAGKVYLYTSNWEGATGDGIAMAFRAGCRAANMEFIQFHPTCLFDSDHRNFLISEALRGEGAELKNKKGEAFTYRHHPKGPLAPRDIVARAIDAEMKETGDECVFLDIRHQGQDFIKNRFPIIYDRCKKLGYDLAKDLLPVVPAAHYLCGGILTDELGRTDIPNLMAVGECAYTGLHGANRLASNSLLECLSFSHFACEWVMEQEKEQTSKNATGFDHGLLLEKKNPDDMMLISHLWDEIRSCMWNYVGIVRSNQKLEKARIRLQYIRQEIDEYYNHYQVHPDIIELRNLATVAQLNIESAIRREASIGTHFNIDRPATTEKPTSMFNTLSSRDFV